MAKRISIRKSKRNPDYYEVHGGGFPTVNVMSKSKANDIAAARRRALAKRKVRRGK